MRNHTTKGAVHPNSRRRAISLAVASACLSLSSAYAQEAVKAADAPPAEQTVVVTGIRASMQSTLNLKRNSDGIVDGIVADDIGKFPDTNLAESLQRISGVSIDRSNGEGQKVTVRGVGPDLNMVLLNGRQMPTSNLGDLSGRAFDFSNLASEAISQIQVYKTSRADTPPGGIGATVNIMTARPFDNPGMHSSVGVKGVYDTSNNHLPDADKASTSLTPEISGIYSNTSADGRWGVAISGSYQKRNLGVNTAGIPNGWRGPFTGDENNWGTIPQAGQPGYSDITNRPKPGDVYSVPQNISYFMKGMQRQRTNGQLALQFKPTTDLTTTLDYTYSENKIQTRSHELSAWFNLGPSVSKWTDGPIASPIYYQENVTAQDIAMNGGDYATKSTNKSLGFNAVWKATPSLKVVFDAHSSSAVSQKDSPFGSANDLATVSFSRGNTGVDFTHEMPVLSIQGANFTAAPMQVSGSWFQDGYQKMTIDQGQASASLKLMEASNLNFGLAVTNVKNRSAFQQVQSDSWGGATKASDYPQSLFQADDLRKYFGKMDGVNDPNLFNQIHTFNFAAVRQVASDTTGKPALYMPSLDNPDYDRRTTEKSKSAFVQLVTEWDTAIPIHTGIGARFEKTDVLSTALSQTPSEVRWVSQNEFPITFAGKAFTSQTGSYHNLLPSLDIDADLRSDFKVRASYGETIGRPRYDQIQGGTTIGATASVNGDSASTGNPALKPVKSKNLDLSAEWYYDKRSLVSLGLFEKKLTNYAGQSVTDVPQANLHTPVGGKYWNAALGAGCIVTDTACIRNYIFKNFNGQPGVVRGPDNEKGEITGVITGQPSDPAIKFQTTSYVNAQDANLHGAEINWQHMFGNSGFGIQANYTYVKSGLAFNNASKGDQFALVGLSNSANLVGIYEDDKWSVRAAYNWRGQFLSSTTDLAGANPQYVEPYGQVDVNVGYAYNKNLSFQLEAINLTDQLQRVHGRTDMMVLSLAQSGPRYMLSARYKF
ncbi:TonB-dependent receptor [Duganella hordei]|uniref:TonB-dependent receptor n=1 Tax=Duganella hordei TaxID=2865934 RepID=UPI0030E9E664